MRDLRAAIVDCVADSPNITEIDRFPKDGYIHGLIPVLRVEICHYRGDPLETIFDKSIALYKQYELDRVRQRDTFRDDYRRVTFPDSRNRTPERRDPYDNYYYYDRYEARDRSPERRYYYDAPRNRTPERREIFDTSHYELRNRTPECYTDMRPRTPEKFFEPRRNNEWNDWCAPSREYQRSSTPQRRYEPPQARSNFAPSQRRENPPRTTYRESREKFPTEITKFCKFCKKPGHDIHECRSRELLNNSGSGNGQGLPKLPKTVQFVANQTELPALSAQ